PSRHLARAYATLFRSTAASFTSARRPPPGAASRWTGMTSSVTIGWRRGDEGRRRGGGHHRLVHLLSTRPQGRRCGRTRQRRRAGRRVDWCVVEHLPVPVHLPGGGASRSPWAGGVWSLAGVHRSRRAPLRPEPCRRGVVHGGEHREDPG